MSGPVDFPVSLRLRGKPVLLIGGGKIAEARAVQLLEAGAALRVIGPEPTARVAQLAAARRLTLERRPYQDGDLAGSRLVFTATDDRSVSVAVAAEARARGILLNAADEPELCDFTLPSVGRKGSITVAVSTEGNAPAVAARLRRELVSAIGLEPSLRVGVSGLLRKHLPRTPWRMRLLRWVAGPSVVRPSPGETP